MECADEIGQVRKSHFKCDVGDGEIVSGKQSRGTAKARANKILMRRHIEDAREHTQKMKWTEARIARGVLKVYGFVRVRVDPERGLRRTASIVRRRVRQARATT